MSAPASIRRGSLPASIGGGSSAAASEAVAPPPPFTVAELLSSARPLDLICLHAGRRASAVIQTVQELAFKDGSFTHVGVVVSTDCVAIRNGKPGELYLWEVIPKPTEADEPCSAESGERKEGVQIRRLADTFYERHRRFGWARLKDEHNVWARSAGKPEARAAIRAALTELLDRTRDAPFDFNPLHSMSALLSHMAVDIAGPQVGGGLPVTAAAPRVPDVLLPAFFCSSLATTIYQTAGVIPHAVEARKVAPIELVGLENGAKGSYFEPPVLVRHELALGTVAPAAAAPRLSLSQPASISSPKAVAASAPAAKGASVDQVQPVLTTDKKPAAPSGCCVAF